MGNAYRSVLALKPTGDAVPANVLAGKTFSNADGAGKIGTMVNNGAVSITLTDQDPTYTIPEGYHNGSGVVGFSASGGDGADLIVTCSDNFAGATISCTDGTTTYQKICPSSSPYEVVFESIPVGTWTISGTAEGILFSTQFTVLDFETELNAIPEGSTVLPTDDIQTWLHCANIWDKNYTSISQVLADASTLQSLIASNNAADYMSRSTSWASSVTADSSAMTYIGANDYCANSLLEDNTWCTSICNSTYFESVLNVKIPTMISNTTPSGVASGNVSMQYYAFDGNDSTQTQSNTENSYPYVQYEFTENVVIKKARIKASSSGKQYTASLQVKDSSSNWNDLQSVTFSSLDQYYIFANNSIKSNTYQFYCTTAKTSGNNVFFQTIQLYGRASS